MRAPPGYLLAARYRLSEPVGRGGMGTVWRAHDELLNREVAVKEVRLPVILDEELRAELCARTEREGRATAMVAHPSVITVFDVVTEDERPWIVMELLRARSLEQLLQDHGPLPPRQVAEIGRQVLGALRAVHAKGILHRDVKPSNVLVTDDRAVLTDFGLAALEGDVSITQAGIVLGSAGYIAPERVLGAKASPAGDLWSLGATLYTAVEGRGLHGRRTAAAALAALTSGEPIPMERAGPLTPVLRGLLTIDPNARLDAGRALMMLARVAAGGLVEESFSRPSARPDVRPPAGGSGGRSSTGGSGGRSSSGGFNVRSSASGSDGASAPPFSRRSQHRGMHRVGSAPPPAPRPSSPGTPPPPSGPPSGPTPQLRAHRRPGEGVHRKPVEISPTYRPLVRFMTPFIRLVLPRLLWPRELRKRG
ncbi:serine/threonine-protein kinase [Streptosporangium sp. NPDC000095]|uniref:serine/threonine-protein kinase n=1 Tax=Streptosporangium sp. NPDC000095 TaxID=3366184 RepID=UPI0036A93C4C